MLLDNLKRGFRTEVARRFGGGKGSISRVLEEAVRLWIAVRDRPTSTCSAGNSSNRILSDGLVKYFSECSDLSGKRATHALRSA